SLLGIKELNAIQWVFGAGNGIASDWIPVYQRCQAAGKGIQIFASADEVDFFASKLRPEGVWMGVSVRNREEAEVVLRRVSKWT
ncbi:MAG: trimethylamine corrinoid protein 2, partial [Candidatus Hydrogenedentes bacterium]|nr:trimethylamine corrinoid protein 2 [Candidatus Hydrogenedentota bacterium]